MLSGIETIEPSPLTKAKTPELLLPVFLQLARLSLTASNNRSYLTA
jgi:hypothetical protein